jgi:Fic family protein
MSAAQKRVQAILKILSQEKEIGTSDLLSELKKYQIEVSQKTLQRDLHDLLKNNQVSQKGKAKNTVYFLSKTNNLFKNIDTEEYFSVPYDNRNIIPQFNFEIFQTLDTEIFTRVEQKELQTLHEQFVKNFSKYNSQTIINKELERILIEFSWKSSQIEGNTYSLLSTERLIKENVPEAGKTREETQMILNHKDAFNEILQNKDEFLVLSKRNIEHIHRLLTKDLSITPNFRSHPVGITGTNYRPLDNVYQIEEAFEKMIDLINQKENFFEKSFLLLLLISYIQAFEDGNKRTARMTSNAVLLAFQSIPMSYRAVDEVEYKKASLLFYEQNNLSYFKKIFLEQYAFAVHNYFL